MAQLDRIKQKIFGVDGPVIEFGVIGSEAAGAFANTKSIEDMQSLSQYDDGLYAIAPNADEPPCAQDINSMYNMITSQIAYIMQDGIPAWNLYTDYYIGSIVAFSGRLFVSTSGIDPTPNVGKSPYIYPDDWAQYTEIITANTTLTPTPINQLFCVQTGDVDITITFPAATAVNKGIEISIYNEDTGIGRVIITGAINTADVYLRSKEVLSFIGAETDTGVYEWVAVERNDLQSKVFQDDAVSSLPIETTATLFEFSFDTKISSNNDFSSEATNIEYIPAGDAGNKFTDRGVFYNNDGCLVYDYVLGNTGYIKFRIKPAWNYDVATNRFIFDTRGLTGTTDDIMYVFYNASTDRFNLRMFDDAGNNFFVLSDLVFTTNPQMQDWIDIVIAWDSTLLTTGDVEFYVNNSTSTKAITGTGIKNINLAANTKMALCDNATLPRVPAQFYFTDMIIGPEYNISTSNYDGSGTVKPNYADNRIAGKNHSHMVDEYGNQALSTLSCQAIDNGGGFEKTAIIPIGSWDMDLTSSILIPLPVTNINKITSVSIFINQDNGNQRPLEATDVSGLLGGVWITTNTPSPTIGLYRAAAGIFDNTNFDDTTINRGVVRITYLV